MYIEKVPNRNSPPAILLRRSRRVGKKTVKETLMNLSDWPADRLALFQRILRNEKLVDPEASFRVKLSTPHGHVAAILSTIRRLKLEQVLGAKRTRERDLAVAMIVSQLIHHCSKLGNTRLWHMTTLAQELGVQDADENELYGAMDWLQSRQERIERKLAVRHLKEDDFVFYDISSSYYEGHTCPLAQFGHNRDLKKGKKIIVYGVTADREGRPVAIHVYPGNTNDSMTIPDRVQDIRRQYALNKVILVGDCGMLTETQIDHLKEYPGIGWISALKSQAIRELLDKGILLKTHFDHQNLAEVTSPDFPGERLVACFNAALAVERNRKRRALLDATEEDLAQIKRAVDRRTEQILDKHEIGLRAGKVINRHKMGKHFSLHIERGSFSWTRRQERIQREEDLDGIYIIRTDQPADRLPAETVVRRYKDLSKVERIFRTCKGVNIRIRPIRHRTEEHVKAHLFLCLLAYYVEWHMRKALGPILFHDDELDATRETRDPVLKASPSELAKEKKFTKQTPDGRTLHSFDTLLIALGTQCRNLCVQAQMGEDAAFELITEPTDLQQRAFDLLRDAPM
ncbi:MAG: IS1634 family transposase [Planctomycetes bacterium]|nr:IS1634 family transposase [Planctomycetota bacterium]